MEKRKYTKVEAFEAEMIAMREAGKTRQEIADYLGLEKAQIKNWINRYNRKQRKEAAGIMLRPKGRPEPDAELGQLLKEQQDHVRQTYGYRRMWLWLENQGIHHNPKTVLRVMKKYGALAAIRRRRKWVQMGQQVHKYENLLNRDFHADRPNAKWVTDISYIHTGQGVLYLSMIRDLYDNSIVAYKTASQQTVNLVLDTIRLATRNEKKWAAGELQLHSDQGFQYTSQAYFQLTKQYGITPSMSRRGNCYDNAMAENFFSILKTECVYRQKIATFQQARELIDEFVYFYNHERIQLKTGVAPLTLRHSA